MTDDPLPPILREAYEHRHDEEPVSELLLERTVSELRSRGLLRGGVRSSRVRFWASVAAAAVVGFVGGEILRGGEGDAARSPAGVDVVSGLEEVQRLGDEHVRAIDALAAIMNDTDGATFRSAQEVLMSSTYALRSATQGFLERGTTPRPVDDLGTPITPGGLIWF